jgi:hypothetical protein
MMMMVQVNDKFYFGFGPPRVECHVTSRSSVAVAMKLNLRLSSYTRVTAAQYKKPEQA